MAIRNPHEGRQEDYLLAGLEYPLMLAGGHVYLHLGKAMLTYHVGHVGMLG